MRLFGDFNDISIPTKLTYRSSLHQVLMLKNRPIINRSRPLETDMKLAFYQQHQNIP